MDFLIRRLAVSIRMPRAALARPPAPRGTGRAAAERAGSFNLCRTPERTIMPGAPAGGENPRAKMKPTMPRWFTDHPLSRKAKPPLTCLL